MCNKEEKDLIVSLDEFRQYANFYSEGTDDLCIRYIKASTDIVSNYLGYNPIMKDYFCRISGTGTPMLYVSVPKICSVNRLRIDGKEIDDYFISDDCIVLNNGLFNEGVYNIEVSYCGGWRIQDIPSAIKMAILRIASLMLSEQGGNIGVTSKSFSDQSRTFVNYSNYNKFLNPLSIYRSRNF